MTAQSAMRELFAGEHAVAFQARPEPIPGDLRLSWRLPVLTLILEKCRGQRSSLQALNVLWWGIRTSDSRSRFSDWLQGHRGPEDLVVRYDPSLTSTLDFALGEGLIQVSKGTIVLTTAGLMLALEARAIDALEAEKDFLDNFRGRITQKSIQGLLEWK